MTVLDATGNGATEKLADTPDARRQLRVNYPAHAGERSGGQISSRQLRALPPRKGRKRFRFGPRLGTWTEQ